MKSKKQKRKEKAEKIKIQKAKTNLGAYQDLQDVWGVMKKKMNLQLRKLQLLVVLLLLLHHLFNRSLKQVVVVLQEVLEG